jgi:[ribosomal protein S18]-alanine N-acetyltransferase
MTALLRITRENIERHLDAIHEIETLSFVSPWSANAFKAEVKNPVSHLWAMFLDDKLLGYICFWLVDREMQLATIAVHPSSRNRGMGRELLTKMIETGLAERAESIWLEVRESNRTARTLYEKSGFGPVGKRRKYYSDNDEDAIVMSLSLPSFSGKLCSNS